MTPLMTRYLTAAPLRSPLDLPRRVASRRPLALLLCSGLLATGTALFPAAAATAAVSPAAAIRTATAPWAATWTVTLRSGMKGSSVRTAQLRLAALGYWVGAADGQYGSQTRQAVLALQKTVGAPRTGVIDRAVRNVLTAGIRPKARTTTGSTVEIDLKRQLLLVVVNGRTVWAFNTSTGNNQYYYQDGVRYLATTPRGRFGVTRQIDGVRVAPLGVLFRPKYFYGGYAVHGSSNIPAYPASHGCARVSNAAIDYLWASRLMPIGRRLWVY